MFLNLQYFVKFMHIFVSKLVAEISHVHLEPNLIELFPQQKVKTYLELTIMTLITCVSHTYFQCEFFNK